MNRPVNKCVCNIISNSRTLTKKKAGIVELENNGAIILLDRVTRDGFSEELSFEQKEQALQRNEKRRFWAEETAHAKASPGVGVSLAC